MSSLVRQVRRQLKEMGFRPHLSEEVAKMGIHLTICQMIVVVLSVSSVVFLFVPFFYLQNMLFMVFFFGLSLLCLFFGIWFWLHKIDICEAPEELED